MSTANSDFTLAKQAMKFVEAPDDVQDVYTNFDISDEIAAQLEAE